MTHSIDLRWFLVGCYLFLSTAVYAQDNNYWTQQYGNSSTLLGGAVTGSYNDNGSIYYNPATLAFRDTVRLSFSAALYQSALMHISNVSAIDSAANIYQFKRFPIAFYPVFKLNKKSSLGLIYLSRIYSSFDFHQYENSLKDVTGDGTKHQFIGSFDYSNITQEDWYGASYSRIINDHSSFGVCMYVSYRYQNYLYQYTADVILNESTRDYLTTDIYHYLNYNLYRGILKFGYYHEKNNFSFGVALTLPSLYLYSSSRSNSRIFLSGWQNYLPGDTINNYLIQSQSIDSKVNQKYPASLNIGIKKKINIYTVYVSGEIYNPIDLYQILNLNNNVTGTTPVYEGSTELLLNSETESRLFGNIGVGVQKLLKSKKILSLGFCTDFNALPSGFSPKGFNTSFGKNNIVHFMAGMDVKVWKFTVNGGFKLSYGYSNNQPQFVDMTTANTSNLLVGDRKNISDYRYYALNLLLGFNF